MLHGRGAVFQHDIYAFFQGSLIKIKQVGDVLGDQIVSVVSRTEDSDGNSALSGNTVAVLSISVLSRQAMIATATEYQTASTPAEGRAIPRSCPPAAPLQTRSRSRGARQRPAWDRQPSEPCATGPVARSRCQTGLTAKRQPERIVQKGQSPRAGTIARTRAPDLSKRNLWTIIAVLTEEKYHQYWDSRGPWPFVPVAGNENRPNPMDSTNR